MADCGGITYTETWYGWKYELRRGPHSKASPNPIEESWMRPSPLNPPEKCPNKKNVMPFVGSCMGDSGGPLIMKGLTISICSTTWLTCLCSARFLGFNLMTFSDESGKHILVGNTSWGTGDCEDGVPAAWSNNFNPEVNSWIRYNTGLDQ